MNEPRVFRGVLCGNGNTIAGTCTIDWSLEPQGNKGLIAAWFEGDGGLDLLKMFPEDPTFEECRQSDLSLETESGTVIASVRIERIGGSSAQLWFLHPEAIERLLPC